MFQVTSFLGTVNDGSIVKRLVECGWVWIALMCFAGACLTLAAFLLWVTERQTDRRS